MTARYYCFGVKFFLYTHSEIWWQICYRLISKRWQKSTIGLGALRCCCCPTIFGTVHGLIKPLREWGVQTLQLWETSSQRSFVAYGFGGPHVIAAFFFVSLVYRIFLKRRVLIIPCSPSGAILVKGVSSWAQASVSLPLRLRIAQDGEEKQYVETGRRRTFHTVR